MTSSFFLKIVFLEYSRIMLTFRKITICACLYQKKSDMGLSCYMEKRSKSLLPTTKKCNKLAKNGSKVTNNTIFLTIFYQGICSRRLFVRKVSSLKIDFFWWRHKAWRHVFFSKLFFYNIHALCWLSAK